MYIELPAQSNIAQHGVRCGVSTRADLCNLAKAAERDDSRHEERTDVRNNWEDDEEEMDEAEQGLLLAIRRWRARAEKAAAAQEVLRAV